MVGTIFAGLVKLMLTFDIELQEAGPDAIPGKGGFSSMPSWIILSSLPIDDRRPMEAVSVEL